MLPMITPFSRYLGQPQMINLNTAVWGKADFTVKNSDGNSFSITVSGRDRWALGVLIETVTEAHDGPFKGTHARYVLQSTVSLVAELEVAA